MPYHRVGNTNQMSTIRNYKKVGNTIRELNIVKANQKLDEQAKELESLKKGSPTNKVNPSTDYTYNGKSISQICADAEQKSVLAKLQVETDAKKREQIVALIKSDKRLFSLGEKMTPDSIQAKLELLQAQEKYEKKVASLKNQGWQKNLWENTSRTSNVPCYRVAKQQYSIAFDDSGTFQRAYIKPDKGIGAQGQSNVGGWLALVKPSQSATGASPFVVGNHTNSTDLTKQEFMSLLESKPSMDQLCSVYALKENSNCSFEEKNIVPLW